jgi:hypothetical protein
MGQNADAAAGGELVPKRRSAMRYAATIQPHPEKPLLLIGTGESYQDALAAARAWFQKEFDHTSAKDWTRLYALQDRLAVSTEDEFAARTGIDLDEWLARMAAAGVAPATAPPVTEDQPLVVPGPRRSGGSGVEKLIFTALICLLLAGSLMAVKYAGVRFVDREIESALSKSDNPFGQGPAVAPAVATFDPDSLWRGSFDPSGGDEIGGIAGT